MKRSTFEFGAMEGWASGRRAQRGVGDGCTAGRSTNPVSGTSVVTVTVAKPEMPPLVALTVLVNVPATVLLAVNKHELLFGVVPSAVEIQRRLG